MIYRAEPQTLMIFNAEKGITAALSGKELLILRNYLREGHRTEFISRLCELGLLPEDIEAEGRYILDKIEETDKVASPLRSFTAPESIHIDLTTVCPLKCPQCYKDASQKNEMTYEVFAGIIEQAGKMGVFQIAIGGGEPLMIKELHKYVKLVRAKGMACTITTSGYGFTLDMVYKLEKAGINHIQVSLNGSTNEIHSSSRDGYEEGMKALKLLSGSGIAFGINWVARMDNIHDFKNIVRLARELQADNINILRYKPSPTEDYSKIALTKEAYELLKDTIKNNRGINIMMDSAFSNMICQLNDGKVSPLNCGCGAGRRFMIIDSFGRLKPCSHMSAISEEKDILGYWRHSRDLLELRQGEENIKGQCQNCRYISTCRGCRAICERLYKDINAGEQNCAVYCKRG
jgi:pyrroloquinoline quinone biosynthesis protein E